MSSSYTSAACALNNTSSLTGLPQDNEFFRLRERDNEEILRRVFVVANPEVYNHMRPQNTTLMHNNVSERLLKYPGIDRRSKNYWTEYLNGKKNTNGIPTNFNIGYSKQGENSMENDSKPYVSGINKNIINENSLKGLGRLNKHDATYVPELVGMEKVMNSMDMYQTYFTVSDNLDNARFFIGNPTRAVNNA